IKTIGIPTFANRTPVFNVETLLTEKVRREFTSRGKYSVLPQATSVDATLTGEVSSISVIRASASVTTQLASRYTVTMTAKGELVEEGLRAFNVERVHAGDMTSGDRLAEGVASLIAAVRTLPMMSPRRVVIVAQADVLLVPRRESEAATRALADLEELLKAPE